MAIQISITGLSAQQLADVGDAFDQIPGRVPAGLTKGQWVQAQLLRYIKDVVKDWKRQAHETAMNAERAQVDSEYRGG